MWLMFPSVAEKRFADTPVATPRNLKCNRGKKDPKQN